MKATPLEMSLLFDFYGETLSTTETTEVHIKNVNIGEEGLPDARLALDLMEELRPCFADRFVLTMVNNRIIKPEDFDFRESGAVFLSDTGRKSFLHKWQERKREPITHPFLEEKLPWGLVPYVQSLLLARYLRGDLDDYPPFLWK